MSKPLRYYPHTIRTMKMVNRLRNVLVFSVVACAALYMVVYIALSQRAYAFSNDDTKLPLLSSPTVVVLGNRAKTKGVPNICMTGRVDKAMALLNQYGGTNLLLSGGVDPVEESFESQVMANHALSNGFSGNLVQEKASTTTFENLKFTKPLLSNAGAKTVVIVSEPHHLWRASLLARGQGLHKQFDLYFVAAKTECWDVQGMFSVGAVREPLALIKNYLQGRY
jgi:uncharacterized SAM-binding protein YcdF (DUF218 family)